jgi:hypothetical protein
MKKLLLLSASLFLIAFTGASQFNKFNNPPVIQDENYAIEIMAVRAEKKSCSFKIRITNNTANKFLHINPYTIGGLKDENTVFYPSTKKNLKTINRTNLWTIEPGKSSAKIIKLPTGEFFETENFSILIKKFSIAINETDEDASPVSISPIEVFSPDKKAENEERRIKEEKKLKKQQDKQAKKENKEELELTNNYQEKEKEQEVQENQNKKVKQKELSIDSTISNVNKRKFKLTYKEEGLCNWSIQLIQNNKIVGAGQTNSEGEIEVVFLGQFNVPLSIIGIRGKKEFNLSQFYIPNEALDVNHFELKEYILALSGKSIKEVGESVSEYQSEKGDREQMNTVMDAQSDFLDEAKEGSNDARMKKDLEMTKGAFKGAHALAKVGMASSYLGNNKSKKEIIKLKTMRLTSCK